MIELIDYKSNPEKIRVELLNKINKKISIQTKIFSNDLKNQICIDYDEIEFKKALARFIHNDKIKQCPYNECGLERKFLSVANGFAKGCGKNHSTKLTNLEKYGVENPQQNKEIKNKTKATNLKKYGVDNPAKSEIIKEKTKETYLAKTGYNSPLENPDVVEKIKKTNLEKYGVENPLESTKVREKYKSTMLERYGDSIPMRSESIKDKYKENMQKNFGVDHYNQTSEFKNDKKRKYYYRKLMSDSYPVKPLFTVDDYINLSDSFDKLKWQCKTCNSVFDAHNHNKVIPRCLTCYPLIFDGVSLLENEVVTFIQSFQTDILMNDRILIAPYELDILIPSKNLAIEFNGLYWHSELNGKDKNYHIKKTIKCTEKGVQLLHIFEDEWVFKKEIVKSIIKAKLGLFTNRIYARKCIIEEIDNNTKDIFLEENHIQGTDISKVKLGLFYNNELIQVMTFGHSRYNKNFQYEMHRFASKQGYQIIGGASKLWKYFIRNYNPESVITYADRRYSNGVTYEKIGFRKARESNPNFFIINKGVRESRLNWQKHKQKDKLEKFNPELTAWENMQINGYDRIWDCGNYVFEWKNQKVITKMNKEEKKYFDLVRINLTDDLIPSHYKDGKLDNPMYGHCHHASLALYDLLGGKEAGYKLRKAIDDDNIIHYWLETQDGIIIDPTVEQYTDLGRKPPYDKQVKKGISYRRTNSSKLLVSKIKQL